MRSTPLSPALGAAGLLAATTSWGSLFLVGKPVLAHVHPVWFTLLRYSIATAGFAAVLLWRGPFPWARLRSNLLPLAGFGLVGYGVFGVMVLEGLAHSVPSHGAVVMATMPVTTQLVRWWLDGQRPSAGALAATALALAGVLMVSGVLGGSAGEASTLPGDLTALAGTFGWITYTRGAARLASLEVLEYSGLTAVASWPLLLAGTLGATALGWVPLPSADGLAQSAPALAYIGIVPTLLGVLAFNAGVRSLGVVAGTAFLNVVPVSAVLLGTAMGTSPSANELAGVAMVVAALLAHTLMQRRSVARATDLQPSRA